MIQFKVEERVVARLLPPEISPVDSQTVGISVTTLERLRAEILAKPSSEEARHWTPAARLEAVVDAKWPPRHAAENDLLPVVIRDLGEQDPERANLILTNRSDMTAIDGKGD